MRMIVVMALPVCLLAIKVHGESLSVDIHRVFGSEHPGVYKHPASIEQLSSGELYIAYYGGSGEYGTDTAVYGSIQKLDHLDWSFPVKIADAPDHGEGNPVVWQAPDGILWLFYNVQYGDTWSDARVHCKMSRNGAKTWTDSYMLTQDAGTMVRGRPILLADGDYLLPVYYERGGDREMTAEDTASFFMRYNPPTKKWTRTDPIPSETGNLQAEVARVTDDYLVCYMRRAGDYEPTDKGYLIRSESRDGGRTWSRGENCGFPNPNSAVAFIRLFNGHLMLVYNDHMYMRTPLAVSISTDDDQTYPYKRLIAGGDNTFAYPYAIQTRDGKIHVIYTTNTRTTIMHAVFDEAAILEWGKE